MKLATAPSRTNKTLRGFLNHTGDLMMIASSTIILLIAVSLPVSGVKILFYITSYAIIGYPVIWESFKNILHGDFFDENFLMTVATIGAIALGDYPEAIAVMLFYQIGELFEAIAVQQSKQSISALLKLKPATATILTDTGEETVKPERVTPGQTIRVKPGEKVPLDGQLIHGNTSLDTSALTGESLPRDVQTGETILNGTINLTGVIDIRVTKVYQESTVARILDLVQNAAQKKTVTEKFITRFAKIYTPIVVGLAVLLAIFPPLLHLGPWATWINRALVFLVISCPCALVISVPLSFFGGIGAASRHGILVKGSNFLEVLTRINTVAFDKTGTLTQGQFTVSEIKPEAPLTKQRLLGIAAAAEQHSNHPIARSILTAYQGDMAQFSIHDVHETAGHGIQATINDQLVVIGNTQAMAENHISMPVTQTDCTTIYVAIDHQFAGSISVADQPKPDAKAAISTLKQLGVAHTVLLTGDNRSVADQIGHKLGLNHVEADLLPAQKVSKIETLTLAAHTAQHRVAFVGDGINDTPVLARADVGIAMGGLGADAAIEAADVVIMDDKPSKIATLIQIAKATQRIVWENITFALMIKVLFLILGAFGIIGMWQAVFADVGVTMIAILNALRLQHQ
ncbi:putative heavy metal-transporting P-type ATPase [Secundilactobacillus pentosiphilus]|uniref:Cd(2+)-exporting ATPase n=1 Tax=Secundilactobacillus pentosiphilus TaxID=1714682 RepID=A0A1Z5INA4_9LACO|nr:heavy metal translocating P-type ATPase [Secundilactobacillus pentosiphilus]GAX03062.1 putative heavy metal-transporting P-type ATPase [Secundilactobacillus pentosiphilus]